MASISLYQVRFLSYVNDKAQTPLVIGSPTQSLAACFAHHVGRPSFILVTKFNAKITMVSTFYETCHWLPIRGNGYTRHS